MSTMFAGYTISKIVEVFSTAYPDSWQRACPRMYKNVDAFHDYRLPAVLRTAAFETIKNPGDEDPINPNMIQIITAIEGEQYGYPLFFVHKELLAAALNTTPPPEIDWQSFRMPFEYMCFVFPKDSLTRGEKNIAFIEVIRSKSGIYEPEGTNFTLNIPTSGLVISVIDTDGVGFHREYVKPIKLNELFTQEAIERHPLPVESVKFAESILTTVFNILLAMAARPEYVERGSRVSTHKKSGVEIWSPNIIGRKYAVKRSAEAQGTHASPRMHWRRGHFRHQPFGKGLTETKVIWLEPTLIGVKDK